MSWLRVRELILRGGANALSNFWVGASADTPGLMQIKRGAAGGGSTDILEISPTGDLVLPSAECAPNPRGAVLQMMLASVLPRVIPAIPGQRSFIKTGGKTIAIKAGTTIFVGGMFKTYTAQTAVVMPDVMMAGEDYGIYALPSGVLFAVVDSKPVPYAPTSAQAGAARLGGFHYGLIAHDALLGGGGFAQTAPSMIWTQADVDKLAGINAHSIWDEGYRPTCDARGMAGVSADNGEGLFWGDIYLAGINHITQGTSRSGATVSSGTVPPKKPVMFGGDGVAAYTTFQFKEAVEVGLSHGKRLPRSAEYQALAFGVTENQSIGGAAATVATATRSAGYTSRWGIEQAAGVLRVFGAELVGGGGTAWVDGVVRGKTHGTAYCLQLGGNSGDGVNSGSRCDAVSQTLAASGWGCGARYVCDHKNHQ